MKFTSKDIKGAAKQLSEQLTEIAQKKIAEKKEVQKMIALKGRKKFIENSITVYRSQFNKEYLDHLKYIKKLRALQLNKFGTSKDGQFRLLLKLPTRLYVYLNRSLPSQFPEDIKESKWFAHKYREFVVAEKI